MENQLSAVLITFVVLLLLWMPSMISLSDPVISSVLGVLSIFSNYAAFAHGIHSASSILYMLSFSIVFLLLTVVVVEKRRWGKG